MVQETISLGKFPLGIDNISPETDMPEGALRSAINADLDKEGNVYSCQGYTQVYSGSSIHSMYGSYFAEGSNLKQLDTTTYTATTIDSGLSLNHYLAWEKVLDQYYYTDGTRNRIIGAKAWGVETPAGNPNLAVTSGMLDAGVYQVAVCFIDVDTGEQGGSLIATTITVPDNSGILCSNLPVSSENHDTVIYVSTQNGEQLYQNAIVSNGLTNYTVINSRKSTRILNTQFMEPLPGGHILRHFKSRLYVARDNVLWYSQAMRYGLHKPAEDFFQFPSRILIVQAVDDGIYVVADKTYWLSGTDPKNMKQTVVSKHTAIEGTGMTIGGEAFGVDQEPYQGLYVGYWFSNSGAVIGKPKGEYVELTDDRLAMNKDVDYGITMYRKFGGIKQAVTNFSSGGTTSGFALGAEATSAIYRNGVLIP